ncbi:MAG: CRTAC1 family protein [Gammaproteobacteria bacterium]|nr:CRTAC1 family protein [Gammaproteobacteria bacterium]
MIALATVFMSSCGGGGGSATAPPAPPPPPPPPSVFMPQTTFANVTASSGIDHEFSIVTANTSDPAEMGGGLSAADFDRDGLIDLYFVGGDGAPNALYRNDGNNQFSDVANGLGLDATHLGSGPAFADIDGDGDLDLFVGSVENHPKYLFRNDGNQFTNVLANSGIVLRAENTISAGFSDYDMDGDLDLVLAHWGNDPQPDTETLWQNNGDGTFTSASIPSGIADQLITQTGLPGLFDYTFAPMLSDIDRDGDPDILFASDFTTSKIFLNNGDATFTDITDRNVVKDRNGMGSAAGDYDNDGDMDWFVTSIFETSQGADPNIGNRLYRNDGNGVFTDVTDAAGVADGGWGWGVCFEDFDNDGDLDIFHVNGWEQIDPRDAGGPNDFTFDQIRYFESQGDGTFVEAAQGAGLIDTGQGRGVACFDSDRDGDLDLVITNNQPVKSVVIYRNELGGTNHYLTVKLNGSGVNTDAIGAMIEISDGSRTQIREIRAGNHFVSQNPAEAHFGLGAAMSVDITITWPDGTQKSLDAIAADQYLLVSQ